MENMKKLNKIIFHTKNIDFHKTRVACTASKGIAYIITLFTITSLVVLHRTPGKVYGTSKLGARNPGM